MSGNPALDRQIMQAVQPQFDPMQAIQQMQRPQAQPVQNPVFGGTIPMNFGLPQASQIPQGYTPRLVGFTPSQAPIQPVAPKVNPLMMFAFGDMFGGGQPNVGQPTADAVVGSSQGN